MAFNDAIQPGDRIFNLVGHQYTVIAGGPWIFRVQPLTMIGADYQPLGSPVTIGRSEIDATRLPVGR